MKQDLNSLLLLFIELFIHLRNEPSLMFHNKKNIDMIWCSHGRFIYLTDKVDNPRKVRARRE